MRSGLVIAAFYARATYHKHYSLFTARPCVLCPVIDYYRERNEVAHESHRRTWLAKHKRLAKELLL